MAIDARIPLGVQPFQVPDQMNALQGVMQLQAAQQSNALHGLQMNRLQRDMASEDALRAGLAEPGADPYKVLLGAGRTKEATEWAAAQRAREKDTLEIQNKTVAMYRDAAQSIADPQSAAAFVTHMHTDPRLKDSPIARVPLEQALSRIPPDAAQFPKWRQEFILGAEKYLEQNKPHYEKVSTGQRDEVLAIPGLGGAPTTVSSVQKVMTPGEMAADRRAGAQLAQSERHHKDTVAAAQNAPRGQFIETTSGYMLGDPKTGAMRPVLGPDGQPVRGKGADKNLTDAQAKANLFGSRMKESDRILGTLEGKYWPGAVNAKMGAAEVPLVGGAAGYAGNLMLTDEGQQAEQAQRDFINAVLRRESGAAIASSEFSNAQKQYFPQSGDSKAVLLQKKRNRQLAIEGLEAEVPGGFRAGPSLTNPTGNAGGATGDFAADPLGIRGGR